MAAEKFLDLSEYHDLDVKSVKVRTLNGDDLVVCAGRCAPAEGADLDPTIFSIMLRQQQIAQSIVEVDGDQVRGPCLASIKWNTRTREFVAMIYDHLNGVSVDEREGFKKALSGGGAISKTQSAASVEG